MWLWNLLLSALLLGLLKLSGSGIRSLLPMLGRKPKPSVKPWTGPTPKSEPASQVHPIMVDDQPTVETCDRCGPYVVAAHFAIRGSLLIGLCGHCGTRHHVALIADGWELLHALVPVKAVAHG